MGTRRVLAVTRGPQYLDRDLLLIEAEGLAPIGLVLLLVGVRLFERAGRRHRKQLETIVDAARRHRRRRPRRRARRRPEARSGRVAGSLEYLAHGLRDLDRERGLYVSQVSHDLRNPLAVIGTYASVLRKGERSRPRAAQLQTIEDEVSRLALMVDDLLALGRTHALALHIQRVPVDVRALVADATTAARARSGRKRVLLLAPAGAMRAVVDAQRLRQALDNLLDNAIRHARTEVRVELVSRARSGRRPERRGRRARASTASCCRASSSAFAHGSDRAGGAGLGLSTVRAIVEAHGGGVSVGEGREGGTRVTLRLPLHAGRGGRVVNRLAGLERVREHWLAATGLALALLALVLGLLPASGSRARRCWCCGTRSPRAASYVEGDVVAVPIAVSDRTPSMVGELGDAGGPAHADRPGRRRLPRARRAARRRRRLAAAPRRACARAGAGAGLGAGRAPAAARARASTSWSSNATGRALPRAGSSCSRRRASAPAASWSPCARPSPIALALAAARAGATCGCCCAATARDRPPRAAGRRRRGRRRAACRTRRPAGHRAARAGALGRRRHPAGGRLLARRGGRSRARRAIAPRRCASAAGRRGRVGCRRAQQALDAGRWVSSSGRSTPGACGTRWLQPAASTRRSLRRTADDEGHIALLGAGGGMGTTTCAVALGLALDRAFVLDLALAMGDAAEVAGAEVVDPGCAAADRVRPRDDARRARRRDSPTARLPGAARARPAGARRPDRRARHRARARSRRRERICARSSTAARAWASRPCRCSSARGSIAIVASADARGARGARRTSLLLARLGLAGRSLGHRRHARRATRARRRRWPSRSGCRCSRP